MPDFTHDGHVYYNPFEFAMAFIGGTWKAPMLYRLKKEKQRYSELKKSMPHISDRQLAATLRELEKHGMITRKVYAEVPPRTEYALTKRGERAIPVIETLRQYGIALMKDVGIKSAFYLGTDSAGARTVKAKKAPK